MNSRIIRIVLSLIALATLIFLYNKQESQPLMTGTTNSPDPSVTAVIHAELGVKDHPNCEGVFQFGSCWYLGAPFQSCDEACAGHGGCVQPATATLVKREQCNAVATSLLGADASQWSCMQISEFSGCYGVKDTKAIVVSPQKNDLSCAAVPTKDFESKCKMPVQRVCACSQ